MNSATIWPTSKWPRAEPSPHQRERLDVTSERLFDLPQQAGKTLALFVTQNGQCVYERYATGISADLTLPSWSMAKSILHALIGILVARDNLSVTERAFVPEWQTAGDPRADITIHDLLTMRSGLEFLEDYVNEGVSDVIQMLWGRGSQDVAAYAANKPLVHRPGDFWSYSSGTTNILSRIISSRVGAGNAMRNFMFHALFEPLGMRSPEPKFDSAGTFKASSFCFCNVEDFARFGFLYLQDGVWQDQRILPAGWVEYARTPVHMDEESGYGAHWWITPDQSAFYASGYEGQHILVVPSKGLVIVKLGKSPADYTSDIFRNVRAIADHFEPDNQYP